MVDLWNSTDRPMLMAIAEMEQEDGRLPMLGAAAERAGIEPERAVKSLERLDRGAYLSARIQYASGDAYAARILHLTERGLREVEQWPSIDPFERLLNLLGEEIANEPDGLKRGKLERARDALKDGGRDLFINVLASLAVAGGGAALS